MSAAIKQSIDTICAKVHSSQGISFPDTVAALTDLGVVRYHIDFIGCSATYYIRHSSSTSFISHVVSTPSLVTNFADEFDQSGVINAIQRTQQQKSTYTEFVNECANAGVVGYMAFLEGKNVAYYGTGGEWHVEWFPGAQPSVTK